jgi:hypothetical protein
MLFCSVYYKPIYTSFSLCPVVLKLTTNPEGQKPMPLMQPSENKYKINISYYMPMLGLYVSVQHILKIKKMLST